MSRLRLSDKTFAEEWLDKELQDIIKKHSITVKNNMQFWGWGADPVLFYLRVGAGLDEIMASNENLARDDRFLQKTCCFQCPSFFLNPQKTSGEHYNSAGEALRSYIVKRYKAIMAERSEADADISIRTPLLR